ncbi:hypothetical protein [Actinoplanes sp. URMC 104]|uniref:hypothetical protein n=1 Tax=Actinoplanes sp. URMC 104 TaxID=3423409 RepID=UPI003F1AF891
MSGHADLNADQVQQVVDNLRACEQRCAAIVLLNCGLLVVCGPLVLAVTGAVQRSRRRRAWAVVRAAYDRGVQRRAGTTS